MFLPYLTILLLTKQLTNEADYSVLCWCGKFCPVCLLSSLLPICFDISLKRARLHRTLKIVPHSSQTTTT